MNKHSLWPLGLVALTSAVHADGPSAAAACASRCTTLSFQVELAPHDADSHRVSATLCAPGPLSGRTLQILLSGATYDSSYWDFDDEHSYVRAQSRAGLATLRLDRIGTGASDRPEAARVTTQSNAYVVHQVVQALRTGQVRSARLGKLKPARIVLVGHSLGAAIAAVEAASYDDVDGVILSGVLHAQGPDAAALAQALVPASGAPAGYLTTADGARSLFYDPVSADPEVIESDDQTKSTVTTGELSDLAQAATATAELHLPVLVAVGDHDRAYCAQPSCSATGTLANERSFYPADANVTLVAVPQTGHVLNLHETAGPWFQTAARWTLDTFGR